MNQFVIAQSVSGTIGDAKSGEGIIGANVIIKGTTIGTTTDVEGNFELKTSKRQPPFIIEVSFIGYLTQEINVTDLSKLIRLRLKEDSEILGEVNIIEQRLTKKQKTSALTVEALDNLAIKETPAVNFYEALGNLKGVDLTSASLGFKIINTRGFNSTSPVRSLQLIDGVDNQAPGLNFSLGNFLGASELDIQTVDIIAGASTAFYGPGAFNGVISMTTKDPFDYQGISASFKVGERLLKETAVRYAKAFKTFDSDYKNFAFKINLFYLTANDWEADNYNPVDGSPVGRGNPGRYDAVNIYGDESLATNNDFDNLGEVLDDYAGLGIFYRPGYREVNLVDYDTRNFKGNLNLSYKLKEDLQLAYNINYGTGTTVYQGENRYSLKNIQFIQNMIELKKKDRFFIRVYNTTEDAGNSYDAVITAFKMNDAIASEELWNREYSTVWHTNRYGLQYQDSTLAITGTYNPKSFPDLTAEEWFEGPYKDSLTKYNDKISKWHQKTLNTIKGFAFNRIEPGTAEFDSLFNHITSRTFTEGGSRFFDRSQLYHAMGEYRFDLPWATISIGGSYRVYLPNSRGNIFDEVVITERWDNNDKVHKDTSFITITNQEFGVYLGVERDFFEKVLKVNTTLRMDKNQNFDHLFSPAVSVIYNINQNNLARISFSSAIRNPSLQDQYLHYNVGRAILLGNINGKDSLVTLESFNFYRNQVNLNRDDLDYFNIAPIQPERVRTVEFGYRGSLFKRLFIDANYYHNWYTSFIGFQFGLELGFLPVAPNFPSTIQALRVTINAKGLVTTHGLNIGLNYYLTDELSLTGNYSYNTIDITPSSNFINRIFFEKELKFSETADPIIPAFNTPLNKFNIGMNGRGYKLFRAKDHEMSFAVTCKWVEGFTFEGSPQFSGFVESYALIDAQVSYFVPSIYCTFKFGVSNVLNNEVFQVYGGPSIGRLAYFSILFEKF